MSFYDCFDEVMKECLAEFDERSPKIKLIRTTGNVMNPATRKLDAGTEAEVDLTGVTVPYTNSQIDGTTQQQNERTLIIDSNQKPSYDDKVLLDEIRFSIISIELYNPGGQIIGYRLQLRA